MNCMVIALKTSQKKGICDRHIHVEGAEYVRYGMHNTRVDGIGRRLKRDGMDEL